MIERAEDTHVILPMYPTFEGADVHAAHLKIGTLPELSDVVVHVDDVIEVVVQCRVTGVGHNVHAPSGQLIRVQTAKALEARLVVP